MNVFGDNSLHCACAAVCTVPRTDVDACVDVGSKVFTMLYGGKLGIGLNYF